MPKLFHDDNGVSVIVGALLLILIVVIAAAGLAMIVSQAEKQQADRQALQDAVKNENLKIVAIKPVYDTTAGPTYGSLLKIQITVQNINIDDAKIGQISLNDRYVTKYHSGSHDAYDTATEWLTVPPSKSIVIELGMNSTDFHTPPAINNTDSIKVQVSTSYYNFFDKTFKPPVASAKFDVRTENLGLVQRDYIMLDASDSGSETGLIKVYQWDIKDLSNGWPFDLPSINTSGNKIRFTPPSNGPFKVTLTVKDNQNDDNAMIGKTEEMDIPPDPNFSPPLALKSIYYQNNTTIVATLKDASGHPCPNEAIIFQAGSNIIVNPTMNITGPDGNAKATVSFAGASTGTVMVSYDKLINNIVVSASSSPPNADFKADIQTGYAPLHVQFVDLSNTPTGSIVARQWDFGDGTANGTSPSPGHTYTTPGNYNVTLTVTNSDGLSDTEQKSTYIMANSGALAAEFTCDLTGWILTPTSSLDVRFTDASSGNINTMQWSFGDSGGNSTIQNPMRTLPFNSGPGDMNLPIILTVYNASGSNTIQHNITLNPHAPIADFTSNVTSPLTVRFSDGSVAGTSPAWLWDFGDGNTSTEESPLYTYVSSGTYMVNLTITNAYGSDTCQKTIYV